MKIEPKHKIVAIRVVSQWEICERTTFYVELETDEGFTMSAASFRTGSEYPKVAGPSVDEARDRALITADTWGDFLGIAPEPFMQGGVEHAPSMTMRSYQLQREERCEKGSA